MLTKNVNLNKTQVLFRVPTVSPRKGRASGHVTTSGICRVSLRGAWPPILQHAPERGPFFGNKEKECFYNSPVLPTSKDTRTFHTRRMGTCICVCVCVRVRVRVRVCVRVRVRVFMSCSCLPSSLACCTRVALFSDINVNSYFLVCEYVPVPVPVPVLVRVHVCGVCILVYVCACVYVCVCMSIFACMCVLVCVRINCSPSREVILDGVMSRRWNAHPQTPSLSQLSLYGITPKEKLLCDSTDVNAMTEV